MERSPIRATLIAFACGLTLLASACGSGDDERDPATQRQLEASLAQYRSSLQESAAHLVAKTKAIATQVEDAELEKAQSRYSMARVRYSQLEPFADTAFADLARRIDSYAGEVPASQFGGFHRVEKALFGDKTVAGVTPVARKLLFDVEELRRGVKTVALRPPEIAAAAAESLEKLPASMTAGEEEPYADIDLIDVAANVEGAEAAFNAVKPLLVEEEPQLVEEIEAQLDAVYAQLDEYGTLARDPEQFRVAAPGTSFVVYSQVPRAMLRKQADAIGVVAGQLSQAAASIADE